MYKTIQSILDNWKHYYILLIADQGNPSGEKDRFYQSLPKDQVYQWYLPFDCGLSYARNFLVEKAKEKNCHYCLLTADSIKFTSKYYLDLYIDFLKNNKNAGIIGFDLENRLPWEYNIKKTNAFELYFSEEFIDYNYLRLKQVDIIRNFFLAKIEVLNQIKWDKNLKAAEHEDMFYRIKKETDYKIYYSPLIQAKYINFDAPEYLKFRKENFRKYRFLAMQKWNLSELFRIKEN